MSALHWFVSVGFTQQLFSAVFCFVLLNRDLVFLTAGLWEGLRWTGVSWRGVCLPPHLPPYQEKGFNVHHGVYKRIEKDG